MTDHVTLRWNDVTHEVEAWWEGFFRPRSHPGLPADILERIDAAHRMREFQDTPGELLCTPSEEALDEWGRMIRHVDDPDGEPWPG